MPWTSPLTPSGRSALVPDGPWYYVFDAIGVHAKGNPVKLRDMVPEGAKPRDDLWFYVADIVSFSPNAQELNYEAPGLLQYREAAIFVRVDWKGRSYAYCPFMYVDSDVSLVRGLVAGFPKKIAHIEMTRFHDLFKPEKYGGLAYRAGYGLMKLVVEPEKEVSELPLDDFGNWLLRRYIKPLNVDDMVEFVPEVQYGRIVEGRGDGEAGRRDQRRTGSLRTRRGAQGIPVQREDRGKGPEGASLSLYMFLRLRCPYPNQPFSSLLLSHTTLCGKGISTPASSSASLTLESSQTLVDHH